MTRLLKQKRFSEILRKKGKTSTKAIKKTTNAMKDPGSSLEIGVKVGTATVSRSPRAALTTIPDAMGFCQTGKPF